MLNVITNIVINSLLGYPGVRKASFSSSSVGIFSLIKTGVEAGTCRNRLDLTRFEVTKEFECISSESVFVKLEI